jgi:ABC-type nickel/cobalt efflux system permease component RcnA
MLWQRFLASKLAVLLSGLVAGAVTAPLLGRAARPVVRQAIKGGIVVQHEVLRIVEGLREELSDLTAEAHRQLGEERAPHVHVHADEHRHGHNHAPAPGKA